MTHKTLFIFDIDNTLLQSYSIYDEAYRLTSKELLGKEFIMTRNPNGTEDKSFSKMSNSEILLHRISQLKIDKSKINQQLFFKRFDENAKISAEKIQSFVYPKVKEVLEELSRKYKLIILTSGTKQLQSTVLKKVDLDKYFDLKNSFFHGDYNSKREAIERIYSKNKDCDTLVHIGDAPSDMKAIKLAKIESKKLAIGVTICGLVTKKELMEAGADLVIQSWKESRKLQKVI